MVEDMSEPAKFIQITVMQETNYTKASLFALDEAGQVWFKLIGDEEWEKEPMIRSDRSSLRKRLDR